MRDHPFAEQADLADLLLQGHAHVVQAQVDEIETARYKVCEKTETALQNIIDEIVGLYLSTLYKLRFLA